MDSSDRFRDFLLLMTLRNQAVKPIYSQDTLLGIPVIMTEKVALKDTENIKIGSPHSYRRRINTEINKPQSKN